MLRTVAVIILVIWLAGLLAHIGGALIHILLFIGVIMLIAHYLRGRGATK